MLTDLVHGYATNSKLGLPSVFGKLENEIPETNTLHFNSMDLFRVDPRQTIKSTNAIFLLLCNQWIFDDYPLLSETRCTKSDMYLKPSIFLMF